MKFKDSQQKQQIIEELKKQNLYNSKATFKAYDDGIFIYQAGKESKGKIHSFEFIPKKNTIGILLEAESIKHLLGLDFKYFGYLAYSFKDGKSFEDFECRFKSK